MSHAASNQLGPPERLTLSRLTPRAPLYAAAAGAVAIGLGLLAAFFGGGEHWGRTMGLAYLTGFSYWLTVSLGALFFVIIHHLSRAGWSASLRRVAELMAANLATLAALAVPVLIFVGVIYAEWVHAEVGDPLMARKDAWLNIPFFVIRIIFYFTVWVAMAWWCLRHSAAQDTDGDPEHTGVLQRYSGLLTVLYGLTVNFAAFDLLMSLDPPWYSTIFGVYIFSGAALGFFCFAALAARLLQRRGLMPEAWNVEHYHDLGKWMFTFVFFWSYIAFSQYMIQWYGNIPEETQWYFRRGATTHPAHTGPWSWVSLLLLFGHCLIPFAGLLSRWVKRWTGWLMFWAVWLLVFHFVDLFWLIMPEARVESIGWGGLLLQALGALLCTAGVGGVWLAGLLKIAAGRNLVAVKDPRLDEALAFENV